MLSADTIGISSCFIVADAKKMSRGPFRSDEKKTDLAVEEKDPTVRYRTL